ncbi:histidinol dehydrogenase [candidate division MSBL1 archaeon SCGC-AAA382A13]|uniref:Histidinol dehydrogenase n=2 Tax=candidate division MSBL1 TaxID=215777 RepID=A0A133VGZ8_9EURY|nr:histidinol dehydrogenase [candidate division MSBL1 archaeon SCGC-AAA382A13]KXB05711.1 histidinol dehydrogenase [candidate division MSBL1 archaeon SCGC-AAA382A03]
MKLWNRSDAFKRKLFRRSEAEINGVLPEVRKIISEIKNRGEIALLNYTEKFDGVKMGRDQLRVKEEEKQKAFKSLRDEYINPMKKAAEAIEKYHKRQLPDEWTIEPETGVKAGQALRPLNSVGVYVPGGNAQYPSSVLMSAIPAKVAGVEKIVMCTPPNSDQSVNAATLIAADIAGVDEIYKAGGAQAIGIMANGGKTVPKVDKIVGPGNIYVAAAKKIVSTNVDIDFVAGPSEVLILADSQADPRKIALDLVAQAEHDTYAASVLVTTSEKVARAVQEEVKDVLDDIPRKRTASRALHEYGNIILVRRKQEAIDFANTYAPEHLQIMTKDPEKILDKIKNAGAIFLGPYSPSSAGDFAVGPSHVLPTGGLARRTDGLTVYDFLKLTSVQNITKEGLEKISEVIEKMSELEGLSAHSKSIRERLEG